MSLFKRWLAMAAAHKVWTAVVILVVGVGGYYGYKTFAPAPQNTVRYVTSPATKDVLVLSIQGNGQVATEDQLDIKPTVSGKILSIAVKEGDTVKKGQVVAEIDQTDALKTVRDASQSVRDAQNGLASARLSLDKLKKPADAITVLQAQDAVNQAQRDLDLLLHPNNTLDIQAAQADVDAAEYTLRMSSDGVTPQMVRDAYDNYVPLLNATSLQLQNDLIDADDILGVDNHAANAKYESDLSASNKGYRAQAESDYAAAKAAISSLKDAMGDLHVHDEPIDHLTQDSLLAKGALSDMSALLKDVRTALLNTPASVNITQTEIDSLRSGIQSDLTAIDTKSSSFITQDQSITTAKTSFNSATIALQKQQIALDKLKQGATQADIDAAQEKLKEKQLDLANVKAGSDATDIALAQNTVDARASALAAAASKLSDAQQALNDYHVVSPFDGVIVSVSGHVTDSASPGTAIAVVATQQKIAQLSLNEVDVSKVKAGQKATLTFDAIDGLSIVGDVLQVDQVGTVTQGVVNYTVKIGFDTADARVRSGMSVSASIILDTHVNALVVPNAAVKQNSNQSSYVLVMPTGAMQPVQTMVQVGIANDSETEILSGLNEGDLVVTQTISTATTKSPTSGAQSSAVGGLRIPGLTGGGAGGFGGGAGGGGFRGGGGATGR